MASAVFQRLTLAALFMLGLAWPAQALQIGETQAQILARHGAPGAEDRGKKLAMYYWEGWSAQLDFKGDVVHKLTYKKSWYLQEPEIAGLLNSNGGAARWREMTSPGAATRQWRRDDGALATCARERPLVMTFQIGLSPRAAAPAVAAASPTVVVPVKPPATFSKPTIYPKLLGSTEVAEPTLKLEESPLVEAPKPAAPKALPKLAAEEINPDPAPATAPLAAEAKPGEPAPTDQAPADPAIEAAAPERQADATPRSSGLLAGVVLLLTVVGGAFYFFKLRAARKETRPASPTILPSAPGGVDVVTVTTPAIDALRPDQFEVLVGEIFRRAGYTVEISAAAAQGDSIDLTLRRDAETILVQCKHWKTSRVTEREVREFYGTMTGNGAPRGIFVTAGSFSRDAREFAEGKGIDLMDRAALEESVAAIARPGENFCGITDWVEEFAANARIFDPECPICQSTMVIRHNRASGAAYWSCRNHPRCPGRREPRRDLLPMIAAAHPQ
jgi:HJR/Mrr/RecB family endonuclease